MFAALSRLELASEKKELNADGPVSSVQMAVWDGHIYRFSFVITPNTRLRVFKQLLWLLISQLYVDNDGLTNDCNGKMTKLQYESMSFGYKKSVKLFDMAC